LFLDLFCDRDHIFEQDFESHCVATAMVSEEELTITAKSSIFKTDMVVVVITVEGYVKLIEAESLAVFGISLGFFDFSNHPIVHFLFSFFREMKKARRQARAF
jgi:hypothetical protein